MVYGPEIMDLADISRLTVKQKYDEETIYVTTLHDNDYQVIYPETAHRGEVCLCKVINAKK